MNKEYFNGLLGKEWTNVLYDTLTSKKLKETYAYIKQRKENDVIVYPKTKDVFNAFKYCKYDNVKVIIIGQDPYHQPNQAHGLSFSVEDGKIPPSLRNIFKEVISDVYNGDETLHQDKNLFRWAIQGVLLLNRSLTVEHSSPNSHKRMWDELILSAIEALNKKGNIVYLLWGNNAKELKKWIDLDNNYIIESAHPSPFSVKNFYGTKPFSKCNKILKNKIMKEEIIW
jgi:uracil-DNA glycosylase